MKKLLVVLLAVSLLLGLFVSCSDEPSTDQVTVRFELNGKGSSIGAQKIARNAKATKPADPTASGFAFCGWYSDSAFTRVYDFDNPVVSSITLYARWLPTGTISTEAQLKEAFSNGGVYTLESDIVFETVTGNSCLVLSAGGYLSLDLNGHVLDANGCGRLIDAAGTLTITDSNPTAGHASYQTEDEDFPNGGVFYNGYLSYENGAGIKMTSGSLALNGGTIYKCSSARRGGALFVGDATASIDGASFKQCSASMEAGAIYNDGVTTIANANFSKNSAANYGGSIFLNSGILDITGATVFVGNTSVNAGQEEHVADKNEAKYGGAIFVNVGATLRADGVTIKDCWASETGGAIYYGSCKESVVTNSRVVGSKAKNGGAVYCDSDGGTITFRDTIFDSCSATQWGGTIFVYRTNVNFIGTTPEDQTHEASAAIKNSTAQVGGAIFTRDDSSLHTDGVSFIACAAKDSGNSRGGALFLESKREHSISNTIFRECTSKNDGGAIATNGNVPSTSIVGSQFIDCEADRGGAIILLSGSTMNVSGSSFSGGSSTYGTIYSFGDLSVTDSDFIFSDDAPDRAELPNTSSATSSYTTSYTDGGAIFVNGGTTTLRGVVVRNYIARNSGGACYLKNGTLVIGDSDTRYSSISNCATTYASSEGFAGGAILCGSGTTLVLEGHTSISNCFAMGDGGAINCAGTMTMKDNASISNCTAYKYDTKYGYGGAIFMNGTATLLDDVSITGCDSENWGPGVQLKEGKSLTVGGRVQIKDNYRSSEPKSNNGIRMEGTIGGETRIKFSDEHPLETGACIYFYPVNIGSHAADTIVMTEKSDTPLDGFFFTHVTSHSIVEVHNEETGKYHLELQPSNS